MTCSPTTLSYYIKTIAEALSRHEPADQCKLLMEAHAESVRRDQSDAFAMALIGQIMTTKMLLSYQRGISP